MDMLILLLRRLSHARFGCDEEAGHRRSILQRRAHDLGWVDDAFFDQVAILVVLGIVAKRGRLLIGHLANDDRPFDARILGNLPDRRLERAADDIDAGLLIIVIAFGFE